LIGEFDDLVFDAGAIARHDALDLTGIHWRAMHVLANDAVCFFGGEGDVAGYLLLRDLFGAKAEGRGVGVAGLGLEARPINGASIEARRSAGLEAAATQAEQLERFSQQLRRRLAGASSRIRLLAAMDETVEKSSSGDDD